MVSNTRIYVAEGSEKHRVSECCELFFVGSDPHMLMPWVDAVSGIWINQTPTCTFLIAFFAVEWEEQDLSGVGKGINENVRL